MATCKRVCWPSGGQEEGPPAAAEAPGSCSDPLAPVPPLKCEVTSWFLIHQESQVAEVSPHYLLMFPSVPDIWKTDSFIEVAMIFLGFISMC